MAEQLLSYYTYKKLSQKPNKKSLQKFNNPISFEVNFPACFIISELIPNFKITAPVTSFVQPSVEQKHRTKRYDFHSGNLTSAELIS